MKKIIYTLMLLFIFMFSVSAANTSPGSVASVINNGDVTQGFKDINKNCNINISGSGSSNVVVSYNISCTEKKDESEETKTYGGSFELVYDSSKNTLRGEVKVVKKEIGKDVFLPKIMQMVPYWTVEASGKYSQIKKKIGKDNAYKKLEEIFDRCYLEEMGVCYSETPSYGDMIYSSVVVLDEKAPNYAVKYFKLADEAAENSRLNKMLVVAAVALLFLIIMFKSMTPGKQKY